MSTNYQKAKQWIANGYPLDPISTRKELEAATELLDEAEELNRTNPTEADENAVASLRAEVAYAGERHWTFQWQIILGAIISVFLLNWCSGNKDEDIAKQKAVIESVQAWSKSDTVIPLSHWEKDKDISYIDRYKSAAEFKTAELRIIGHRYYGFAASIESYEEIARKTDDKEKRENALKKAAEIKANQPQQEKELSEKYAEISSMSFEDIQKMAVENLNKTLNAHTKEKDRIKFWFWFLIICTPLYIFACRPYGYNVTRYATETKALNLIQKIGMWLSGGLVAGSAALQFTTIITKWSDGSTTESDDGMGPAIAAAKIALLVAALVVFCFTCCFIMAYATIVGLIRNYDWTAIFAKAKTKIQKTN